MLGADEHSTGAWIAGVVAIIVALIGVWGQRRGQSKQTQQTQEQKLIGIYHRTVLDLRAELARRDARINELEQAEESS